MNTAVISPCEKYRYYLSRKLAPEHQRISRCAFIMLNPSTADATKDDPTIRRCMAYAEREGAGELIVGNLYAYRTPSPKALRDAQYPVGEQNDLWLYTILRGCEVVIVGWGTKAERYRVLQFEEILDELNMDVFCLHQNTDGSPGHPLFLKADAELLVYEPQS